MARLNFLFLFLATLFLASPIAANSRTITVKSYQSIQKAINKAQCGDKIIVEKGTYREQLLITKDDITLIGRPGATLIPPNKLDKKNPCYGLAGNVSTIEGVVTDVINSAGICVFGKVTLKKFVAEHRRIDTVTRLVKKPSISGFTVRDFNGLNIAVVGAEGARIFDNHLTDGLSYGFLTVASKNTRAERNIIDSTPGKPTFIALCMDDKSDVQIVSNQISGYFIGLCVQTNYADVKSNVVTSVCNGIFVDPKIVGAKITSNYVANTAALCGTFPFPASFGIVISGATDTVVTSNVVENINDGGNDAKTAVGIIIMDDTNTGKLVVAKNNKVKDNYLRGNELDIQNISTGPGNVAKNNKCTKSSPAGACTN